ncbi:MAG: (2Fe-2S) ferredoxin domain-containing protein [Magnetococcales bacterium]|nr:(2Fe-2S) ferredoxin domain-containing protein [Magnetococcales bacterium]
MEEQPLYDVRIFCCVNSRDADHPRGSCSRQGAIDLHGYLAARLQHWPELVGRVRVNASGCLNRCEWGPVLVIHPPGVWYRYRTQADLDEIIQSHLAGGAVVQRLLLSAATAASGDKGRRSGSRTGAMSQRGRSRQR